MMPPNMRGLFAVTLVLMACGDSNPVGHLPDGPPPPDAAIDAPIDGQGLPVTLTITNNGQPMVGITVYFINADDTPVATAQTDSYGVASAVMAAGGSVTAVNPFLQAAPAGLRTDELRTFAGVKPGDQLVLTQTVPGTVTFTLVASPVSGADHYDVFTTCGTASISPGGGGSGSGDPNPGGTLSLDGCNGMADIAVVSHGLNTDENDVAISGLYHPAAMLTQDGTVNLTEDPYNDLTSVTFTYMNAPDASLSVLHFPVVTYGKLGPFFANANGGEGSTTEPMVGATAAIVDTQLQLSGRARHDVIDWGAYTDSYMLDLGNLLLPEFQSRPSYDATTRQMTWDEGDGAMPDLSITAIDVTRSDETRMWHWQIVAPYSAGKVQFPKLPAQPIDWNPTVEDSIFAEQVLSAKVPGGYDAARAHALDVAQQLEAASDRSPVVTGATGRAVVVQSQDSKGDRKLPQRVRANVNRNASRSVSPAASIKVKVNRGVSPFPIRAVKPSASRMQWTVGPSVTSARAR
jgi:hypothetical protein